MHYLQLSFLDSSVKHWNDTIGGATWMTGEGGCLDDTLITVIPLRVSG
ncbi:MULTISPECIES: hypothetical protein [unclassified Wolbachia]|nr:MULTISPECIES: hypothetical protein [unclassified Wolbachia]